MTTTIPDNLLGLLLALKNLKTPLSQDERNKLVDMGKNLKENPNDQYLIKKDLMAILKANDTLKQLYKEAKAKLDALDRPIPTNLLPTKEELETVLPPESDSGKYNKAYFEGKPDDKSNEILNLATNVVSTEKPEETAKKLPFLERLSQSLNQPSKND